MNALPPLPPPETPAGPNQLPPDSVAHNYQQAYGWSGGMPPPPGYGHERRGGMPVWGKVLIVGCLVMLGGCSLLVWYGFNQLQKYGLLGGVPPPQVHIGTALQWQELMSWPQGDSLSAGGIRCANFDADPDPELLLLAADANYARPSGGRPGNATIVELNGSQRPVTLPASLSDGEAWDYDGDGQAEIVAALTGTEVYDSAGNRKATLNGTFSYGYSQGLADVDGDSHDELLLTDPLSGSGFIAFGNGGKEVWRGNSQMYASTWGNVDGDPRDELIEDRGGSLTATDSTGQTVTLSGWSAGSLNSGAGYGMEPLGCADIDGDGQDEVVSPRHGYLNPKTGKYVTFTKPYGQANVQPAMTGSMRCAVAAGDFDGDGRRELAVADSGAAQTFGFQIGTALILYRQDGSVLYYEEFGKWLLGLTAVRDGQRDRLALLLPEKLLLSP